MVAFLLDFFEKTSVGGSVVVVLTSTMEDAASFVAPLISGVAFAYTVVVAGWRMVTLEAGIDRATLSQLLKTLAVAAAPLVGRLLPGRAPAPAAGTAVGAAASLYLTYDTWARFIRGRKHDETAEMTGKVCVVTGANAGIGYATARGLARMGATVVFACRSEARALAAMTKVRAEVPGLPEERLVFMPLDVSSLASVRAFAEAFASSRLELHVLINNAGVMRPGRAVSAEGFELTMASNHLGHFLLTNLLLPHLDRQVSQSTTRRTTPVFCSRFLELPRDVNPPPPHTHPPTCPPHIHPLVQGADARIVVVASSIHKLPKRMDFDDIMSQRDYSLFGAYGKSKLANVLFALELQRRLDAKSSKVTVNALHPGNALTEVTRDLPWLVRLGDAVAYPVMAVLRKTMDAGAYTSLYLASSPEVSGMGGKYFVHCEPAPMSPAAKRADDARQLWELSELLCKAEY